MSERRALGMVARLILFYTALGGVAWLVDRSLPSLGPLFAEKSPGAAAIAMLGALALVCPVAWMYMKTKPKARYDSSLVQTVIVLPVVIAGVVLIVRDSIALAFSLAGIVAAVRFRNTLKDTKDAVYVFLAIAVGIAAGVESFSTAFVVSVIFAFLVLVLWRYDIGMAPDTERVRGRLIAETAIPTAAHPAIAGVLEQHARSWKLVSSESGGARGHTALTFLVLLRPRTTADELVAAVRRDAAGQIASARFEQES